MKVIYKISVPLIIIILLLVGCNRQQDYHYYVNEIVSLDKKNIGILVINQSGKTIFIDEKQIIDEVIGYLNLLKVQELTPEEELILFDNGKKLSKETTYTFKISQNRYAETYIVFLLLSKEELVIVNTKPADTLRSISYLCLKDQSSLEIVSKIYGLIKLTNEKNK